MTMFLSAVLLSAVVAVPGIGDVRVDCERPNGWTISATCETENDVSLVNIRMSSPSEAVPPKFGLRFATSGVRADHLWTASADDHATTLFPQEWFGGVPRYESSIAYDAPIAAAYCEDGRNVLTLSTSEALRKVRYDLAIGGSDCRLYGRMDFFTAAEAPIREYEVKVRIDRRPVFWAQPIAAASEWISRDNGFAPMPVPEAAKDPLYSTWYAFWQDVHADVLEREAPIAASLGMKTMILDDGWQKEKSRTDYSATGDWMPVKGRFPDMKGHVARIHAAGLRYMLWLSVPFVGDESAAWKRFQGKFLYFPDLDGGGMGVLDPRFPEVREYLIATYERCLRDWDFDGLKLDFIDWFRVEGEDPALKDGFAGRDIRSVPEAVNVLMKNVVARLRKLKPDVLLEFRQHYLGPAIRQFGNMIRVQDCPADSAKIRRLMCDLRLTSGRTAVHSDMLVWDESETDERAARPILNSLFSVIQYSMVLEHTSAAHREVIRAWLEFTQKHRKTLLDGVFRPYRPDLNYPRIEAESDEERIVAVYSDSPVVPTGAADKPVIVVNARPSDSLVVDFAASAREVRTFDVRGKPVATVVADAGPKRLAVPPCGRVEIRWKVR